MKLNRHVSRDQFELLLRGEPDERLLHEVTEHVDSCAECQQRLDALAADPKLWAKASKLISAPFGSDSTVHHAREGLPIKDESSASIESDPADHLLDAPSHPEMMGRIDSYDIEREVGRGGMGIVFKAFDTELNRPLAIKVLAPWLARNGAARERFEREARAAAAVLHPNVVSIYGVNAKHKMPYLVMPYVAGPSLQRLIDENGPLAEKDVVRMALQVSAGLAAAHAQGLVHRDIKPANILVEADVSRVLVTDFGLARAVDDASATQSGYFVGTPNYMSPEQALGQRVDARSDLFSLGSVIYFMSTGRMPFRAESPLCVLNRISHDEPTGVQEVNSDISKTLADVIGKLLAKDPEHRFQTSSELHDTLEKYLVYLHQPDVSKPPVIASLRSKEKSARSSIGKSFAAVLAITIAVLAAGFGADWFSLPAFMQAARLTDDTPAEKADAATDASKSSTTSTRWKQEPVSPSSLSEEDEWRPSTNRLDFGSGGDSKNWEARSNGNGASDVADGGIPGKIVAVEKRFAGQVVDGYSIYLPRSYEKSSKLYPVLMCLQGGSSVGGEVSKVNTGVYLLLHKSHDPRTDLNAFLQDSMIIVSPHISSGEFYDHASAMQEIVDEVVNEYRADKSRVYLSGISRGGSGVWGLASRMPNVFAAVAPLAGGVRGIEDFSVLATVPIWVAHNKGDKAMKFEPVSNVVDKLERLSEPFHRISANEVITPADLAHSKVFVVGESSDHDAWSGAYNNVDFYQWLLKHKLDQPDEWLE